MISPPRRGDRYPGRLPPVREQWRRLPVAVRAASIGVPVVVTALVLAANLQAGVTIGVLMAGVLLATAVYVKNRTDRHNAAVDRGEIRALPDPHFCGVAPDDVPAGLLGRVGDLGPDRTGVGRVVRFDAGWIVRQRNPRDVAFVLGDDGGWARFDPRTVTDLWAVGEYTAGRGHDG